MAKKVKTAEPAKPAADVKLDKAKKNVGTFKNWRGVGHPAHAVWSADHKDFLVLHAEDAREFMPGVPLAQLELHRGSFVPSGNVIDLEEAAAE